MPVYNVEMYLEESVESLIKQSLNFEKNVQLILINDGSTDNSEKICLSYAEAYPDNIIYINQKNQGVSVARNTGIEAATGKYINFLDSDDYFDKDTLEKVLQFLTMYEDEIDLVAIPLIYFEDKQGPHMLHYKFEESKVIDVVEEPDKFVMQSGSTFINREKGLGDLRFLPGQKYGEDASLLIDVVMKKKKYGVLNNTKYNYRARSAGTSALQSSKESYDYYFPFFEQYLLPKLQKYSKIYNEVPKYVQYVIMYDLQWRLRLKETPNVIKEKLEVFFSKIIEILSFIDEDVIMNQRYLNWYQKHAIINMKQKKKVFTLGDTFYSTEIRESGDSLKDLIVIDKNQEIRDQLIGRHLSIDICENSDGNLKIIGKIGSLLPQKNLRIYILDSEGTKYPSTAFNYPLENRYLVGKVIYEFTGFSFNISTETIQDNYFIALYLEIEGVEMRMPLKFSPSARLSNQLKNSYMVMNNSYMIDYDHDKYLFNIQRFTYKNMLKKELLIKKEMKKKKVKNYKKISRTRLLVRILKRTKKKEINLYMDRIDKADDSAEVLFRYANQINDKSAKNYFVLKKESQDYRRLSQEFDLIDYKSSKHKLHFLLADKLISTHCDRFIYQPFTGTENYFKDLKEYKFVFLQHGIIKDDMSNWLKMYDKNFKLFVTSAQQEANSIIKGNYSFTEKEVKLTGLPRFDRLIDTSDSKRKTILVMPTWRQNLVEEFSKDINARPYNENFKKTEYFNRWNTFLNDENLINFVKNKDYEIVFVPHPSIRQQLHDFNLENITVASYDESYSSLLKRGNLLITDYSSVYFDFAYMKKPLLYYHFDMGNWDNEKGYFSYEEMGFGEIITRNEELVEKTIKLLNHQSKMSSKYSDRVELFYAYTDQNNSERVYKEIKKL